MEGSRTVLWNFWNVNYEITITLALVSMWNSIGVLFSCTFITQSFLSSLTVPRKGSSVSPWFDLSWRIAPTLGRFAHSLVTSSFSTLVASGISGWALLAVVHW